MRLKNVFSLFAILLANVLMAQSLEPYALFPDSLFASQPFSKMDTSSFRNTNLLLHKKVMGIHWPSFQGKLEDSTFHSGHRFQPILDARRICVDTNQFPTYQELLNREHWVLSNLNANPLTLCYFDYDAISDSLLLDSTVYLNSSGVFNLPPNSDPFVQQTLFLVTGNFDGLLINENLSFVIPDTLIFGNTSTQIIQLKIDLGDGEGLRNINTNQPFTVSYTENEADTEVTWHIEASLSTGKTLYAKMTVQTNTNGCNPPSVSPGPWGGQDKPGLNGNMIHWKYQFPTSLTQSWNGKIAEANTYVWYRKDIAVGEENKFRKPLIIVEGIDFKGIKPGDGLPPNTSTHMGDAGWPTMWDCDSKYPFEEFPNFLQDLHDENYDIILIDFHNGVEYIQRNGLLLSSILQEVNSYKIGEEQTTIVGASMGGQVARYALTYMEKNDIDHCTGLFASLDSPWKGAHIPLSIQWFINTAAGWGDADGLRLKANINSPAAKQLLRFHYLANTGTFNYSGGKYERIINYASGSELSPDPLYTSFYNEISYLGDYPKFTRNVTYVNGNIQNNKTFSNDGQTYVDFNVTISCPLSFWPNQNYILNVATELYAVGAANGVIFVGDRPLEAKRTIKVFGARNLDNVEGSVRADISREVVPAIRDALLNGLLTTPYIIGYQCLSWYPPVSQQDQTTFVPTASALNLDVPTLYNFNYGQLDKNNPSISGLTHFDAYYADPIPQSTGHVQGTIGNLNWLKAQILTSSISSASPGSGPLTKQWNLPIATVNVPGMDVNSGGVLEINSNNPIYDSTDDDDKEPTGGLAKVSLGGNCINSTIMNINSGGQLSLGDPIEGNQAYLYIREGGVLNVNQGGSITINQGCKIVVATGGTLNLNGAINVNEGNIIIEEGGDLIIDVNAQINLQQSNTELLIQGKLTVEDNVTLTNNGLGKMIFDQQVLQPNGVLAFGDYMDIGVNATIDLNGTSGTPPYTQELIEIRKPLYLIDGNNNTFREVEMNYGLVKISGGALLYIYGEATFHHVTFTNAGLGRHDGVRLWNGTGDGILFNGCTFNMGKFGILADWIGGGPALQINNCTFDDNLVGLRLNGGNINLISTEFNDNKLGFIGNALSGVSTIGASRFIAGNTGEEGIVVTTQNGAIINISNTEVKNFVNSNGMGMNLHGVEVNLTCSDIINNDVGIDIWDGVLYINNQAGNRFINNTIGIQYSGESIETGIYLFEGENTFSLGTNGSWYIQGVTQNGGLLSSYFNATTVDADLNEMPTVYSSSTGAVIPVRFGIDWNTNALGINIPNNYQNNTTCGNPQVEQGHPFLVPINLATGDGGDYAGGTFKNALVVAVEDITFSEEELDDFGALSSLLNLLEANITNQDASYLELRRMAIGAAMSALENCVQFESIPHAEGGAVHPDVARFIDVLESELDSLDPADSLDHSNIFRYTLNQTQVYRVAGNFSQAQTLFSNLSTWTFSNRQANRAQYWDCVCDAENDFYLGLIGVEDFVLIKDQCDNTYQGFNYKTQMVSDTYEAPGIPVNLMNRIISVFPKPVTEVLTIQIDQGYTGKVEYVVRNSAGAEVQSGIMNWTGTSREELSVRDLSPGVYFINFMFGQEESQSFRILKK